MALYVESGYWTAGYAEGEAGLLGFALRARKWRKQPVGLLAPNPAVLSRPVALWDARHATDWVGASRNLSRVGSPQNTVAGVAFRTSASTGNRFDTGGRLPSASRYKPTGDVTFAVYFIKRSSAGSSQRMGGCTAGTDGFAMGEGYGLNYSYANIGGIQMGLSALWPLDTPVVAVVTKRGSTGRFFVNGALHGSSSSVGSMSYDASFASMFWGGNVDGGPPCTTDLFWLVVDNVGWSDDRCRDLCRDPWSVFAPSRDLSFFGGAPAAPTLSLPGVIDIGATSARPRVTLDFA